MAIKYINNANINKSVIFVDSQSVLSPISSRDATKNTHVRIYRNEQADQLPHRPTHRNRLLFVFLIKIFMYNCKQP